MCCGTLLAVQWGSIYPADLFASVCMTINIFDSRVFQTDSNY
jgi:hypothetical protein